MGTSPNNFSLLGEHGNGLINRRQNNVDTHGPRPLPNIRHIHAPLLSPHKLNSSAYGTSLCLTYVT
jgi:hypothetical protein